MKRKGYLRWKEVHSPEPWQPPAVTGLSPGTPSFEGFRYASDLARDEDRTPFAGLVQGAGGTGETT